MIMSVSTLMIGKGAATPVSFVNFSMERVRASLGTVALQEAAGESKGLPGRSVTPDVAVINLERQAARHMSANIRQKEPA
jgi:hypothetical protein